MVFGLGGTFTASTSRLFFSLGLGLLNLLLLHLAPLSPHQVLHLHPARCNTLQVLIVAAVCGYLLSCDLASLSSCLRNLPKILDTEQTPGSRILGIQGSSPPPKPCKALPSSPLSRLLQNVVRHIALLGLTTGTWPS